MLSTGWFVGLAAATTILLPRAGHAAARLRLPSPWRRSGRRHRGGGPHMTSALRDRSGPGRDTRARLDAALLSSLAMAGALTVLLPLPFGLPAGLVAVVVLPGRLRRLERGTHRRERRRVAADAPLAAELFAACVLGGAEPVAAATVVARAVGGPLGSRLEQVSGAIRLGTEPAVAWSGLAADAALAGWGMAMARASSSGAPVARTVLALAEQARAARRAGRSAAVRRVSVWAMLPLGLCFLPAFLLLGVVPVAVSVAGPVLGLAW